MSNTAFVGLGSNLGDRLGHLRAALNAMAAAGLQVEAVSSVYESAPMYVADQPTFYNAAARLRTGRTPSMLLSQLLKIETELGRVRAERFGPRTVDLDILLLGPAGGTVVREASLVVPHPRLLERSFALVPLAEVGGECVHPMVGRRIADLAAGHESDVRRLDVVLRPSWALHGGP